jgi:hypothetical protein
VFALRSDAELGRVRGMTPANGAKGRERKLHSGAMRDSLREAIRTATRRKLNADEAALFLSFIDEMERRAVMFVEAERG